jgi:hypothetical protein
MMFPFVSVRLDGMGVPDTAASNAKRPRGFPAGAIPTVDFLLHHFGRVVKTVRVKSHHSAGSKYLAGYRPSRPKKRRFCQLSNRAAGWDGAKFPYDAGGKNEKLCPWSIPHAGPRAMPTYRIYKLTDGSSGSNDRSPSAE